MGETGCGQTTVGRTILRLIEPTSGRIEIAGKDITNLDKTALRPYRRQMQIIFQDPFSSLDPRMSAGDIVAEPLDVHGVARRKEVNDGVAALFERVGLRKSQMNNYQHQFSGGQRQRIGIARALALQPKLIIGDEPVSALDVSIQAQVLNLMMDLQNTESLLLALTGARSTSQTAETPAARRCAESDKSAAGLPLPYPLSLCGRALSR